MKYQTVQKIPKIMIRNPGQVTSHRGDELLRNPPSQWSNRIIRIKTGILIEFITVWNKLPVLTDKLTQDLAGIEIHKQKKMLILPQ